MCSDCTPFFVQTYPTPTSASATLTSKSNLWHWKQVFCTCEFIKRRKIKEKIVFIEKRLLFLDTVHFFRSDQINSILIDWFLEIGSLPPDDGPAPKSVQFAQRFQVDAFPHEIVANPNRTRIIQTSASCGRLQNISFVQRLVESKANRFCAEANILLYMYGAEDSIVVDQFVVRFIPQGRHERRFLCDCVVIELFAGIDVRANEIDAQWVEFICTERMFQSLFQSISAENRSGLWSIAALIDWNRIDQSLDKIEKGRLFDGRQNQCRNKFRWSPFGWIFRRRLRCGNDGISRDGRWRRPLVGLCVDEQKF